MRFLCRRGRNQDLAATYESRRNSDAAPWRSSDYGELAELFFAVAIKSGGKRQETCPAEDEIQRRMNSATSIRMTLLLCAPFSR